MSDGIAPGPRAEITEVWDGPLFAAWSRFREAMKRGLDAQGEAGLSVARPLPGERALDVGCGFGDTTKQLAALVAPDGAVLGIDISPSFIEAAGREAAEAGIPNATFEVRDAGSDDLGGPFDLAFSRFGTMFFADPVAGLRHVRESLVPGGRLVMVVWRRREDNHWAHRTQAIVESLVERPAELGPPGEGPGPFSMADADAVGAQLRSAGFESSEFHRFDRPMRLGRDIDEAVDLSMTLGPGGEVIRVLGDRLDAGRRAEIAAAVRDGLREWVGPEGVVAPASTWAIEARNPG
jgi:SAM-dependent methyltransferase